jgi:hypothetical protein
MASRFRTRNHTFTTTDEITLSAIVGTSLDEFVGAVSLRAWKSNVDDVFWEDEDGEDGGFLMPREAASWELGGAFVKSTDIAVRGAIGDTVYITVVG